MCSWLVLPVSFQVWLVCVYNLQAHHNKMIKVDLFIWGLIRFQHRTGHITMGSWKGRGKQYIQFVWVLYYKLPTNSKQLPAFPLEAVPGTEPWPQRWEARVLPLCHRGPSDNSIGQERELTVTRHRQTKQDGLKVGGAMVRIKSRGGSVKYQTFTHCSKPSKNP